MPPTFSASGQRGYGVPHAGQPSSARPSYFGPGRRAGVAPAWSAAQEGDRRHKEWKLEKQKARMEAEKKAAEQLRLAAEAERLVSAPPKDAATLDWSGKRIRALP